MRINPPQAKTKQSSTARTGRAQVRSAPDRGGRRGARGYAVGRACVRIAGGRSVSRSSGSFTWRSAMSIRIGSIAPDFEADSTQGRIRFHQWIGDSWCVLFSHPKDFTPVCTTELGYMARLKPEFDRRNTKVLGLSADPVSDHARWVNDIKETQGHAVNYPLVGDADLTVAKLRSEER